MYLECSVQIEAEIPNMCLSGLETSQGSDCGTQLGKHSFLLWLSVWKGNKEADQTLDQKAMATLCWSRWSLKVEKKRGENVQKHCPALLNIIRVQYFPKINLVV